MYYMSFIGAFARLTSTSNFALGKRPSRRLQSGELSPEEAAAARARLKALEAERASLLAAAAAVRDSKLAALDEEEAELLRRLESGELTPGKLR